MRTDWTREAYLGTREVYLARAVERTEANDHEGALKACNRALQKDPHCIAAYKARAAAFGALGRVPPASAASFVRSGGVCAPSPTVRSGRRGAIRAALADPGLSVLYFSTL